MNQCTIEYRSAKTREELKIMLWIMWGRISWSDQATHWLSLFKVAERLLKSWRPIKAYFLAFGADALRQSEDFFRIKKVNEMASDEQPAIQELCLYFTKFFMSQFQDTILNLENQQLPFIFAWSWKLSRFVKLKKKSDGKFLAWRSNYLTCSSGWQIHYRSFVSLHKNPHLLLTNHHVVISRAFALTLQIEISHHLSRRCFKYGIPTSSWNITWKVVLMFQQGTFSNFVETCAKYYVNSCVKCMRAEDFQCHLKCVDWWLKWIGCPLNLWELNSAFVNIHVGQNSKKQCTKQKIIKANIKYKFTSILSLF